MKCSIIGIFAFLVFCGSAKGQENVFTNRAYWKANPSLEQVKADIAKGNDATELNINAFDAVTWALIEKTDNAVVKYLLSLEGNGVNKLTHDGRTYIFWAAYKDNLEMMQYLFDRGAKLDVIDSHGYSVLNFAATTGQLNTKLYDFLIERGADPKSEVSNAGANALLLVAPFMKDDSLINYFKNKGVSLNSKDDKGNGIFNYAARRGNIDLLDKLIKLGVDYKTPNKEGGNAFIFASQGTRGHSNTLKTYKYLESLGIQPNVTTADGFTPLHALAFNNKDLDIFDYFIAQGVDLNQPDMNGNTAFTNAAGRNNFSTLKHLVGYVNDINAANAKGQTALMRAVRYNSAEVVTFLLNQGADATAKDNAGNSLAYYLIGGYNSDKTDIYNSKFTALSAAGLDMNETQSAGDTLWHLAVKANDLDLLKELTKCNIPINQKNSEGLTPLHLAAMKAQDADILKFLIAQGADKNSKTDFDESVFDLAAENELLNQQNIPLNFLKI